MNRRLLTTVALAAALLLASSDSSTTVQRDYGILGRQAPAWNVETWFNLPEGKRRLDIADFRGKVVYLFGFQAWCPGCHSHGFPTLKKVHDRFAENDDVAFVAIQTVFEGFKTNTAERAPRECARFGLDIPVGHDAGPDGARSSILTNYRTGGTPWTIIIDRRGVVRFNNFSIDPKKAGRIIEGLLDESAESR